MNLRAIERQIEYAEDEIRRLREKRNEARGGKMFRCVGCNGIHKIKTCDAIEPFHHSNEAYNEGWYTNYELWALCPKTGIANRFLIDTDYSLPYDKQHHYSFNAQQQFYNMYKYLFKSVTEYKSNWGYSGFPNSQPEVKWINNDYVNKNRKKFGITELTKR